MKQTPGQTYSADYEADYTVHTMKQTVECRL